MDQVKQAQLDRYEQPVTRLGDEASQGMSNPTGIRPLIEADRNKQITGDFVSAENLLKKLLGEDKPVIRPSDERVSPGIKLRSNTEEKTIIDNWNPNKDNGADQLKNGRKPVKDFYIEEPVKR